MLFKNKRSFFKLFLSLITVVLSIHYTITDMFQFYRDSITKQRVLSINSCVITDSRCLVNRDAISQTYETLSLFRPNYSHSTQTKCPNTQIIGLKSKQGQLQVNLVQPNICTTYECDQCILYSHSRACSEDRSL